MWPPRTELAVERGREGEREKRGRGGKEREREERGEEGRGERESKQES